MFRNLSLSAKLLLTYVPLFVVAIVGSYMLTTSASEEQMLAQARKAADQKAKIVRESLVFQMLENERVDDTYLRNIRNVGGIEDLYIRIFPDSLHLKDWLRDSVRTVRLTRRMEFALAKRGLANDLGQKVFSTGSTFESIRGSDYERVIPFKAEKPCQTCHAVQIDQVLGAAHIELSLTDIQAAIEANSRRTAFISAGFAVVALGIGFVFFRTLVQATEQMGQGNMGYEMWVSTSNDELGRLTRLFERMRKALKQSQEALRTSMVGQIADSLIRDFKAPIREILTAVDQIQRGSVDDAQKNLLCESAKNSVQLMSKMAQDLADFTTGELKINKMSCNVPQVINYVATAVQQELAREEIRIDIEQNFKGNARLDYDRIARALINIINYSANYTPPGGTIKLSTHSEGNNVIFKVSDNGSGIPAMFRERVFEPFVKIVQEKGVGLNMALAKRIIDMQGGKIEVESQEGRGTTFTITMPI